MMINMTLVSKLHDENKTLQNVILDFRHVSRDLYELHRSMLNMMNADQAFVATEKIVFLEQFIQSTEEFKKNMYSLKLSLVSLPLAYKTLEEVEVILSRWLDTSYPKIKDYQHNISQSAASHLSRSLDENIRTQAIQKITGFVSQVKDMWYEYTLTVTKQVGEQAKSTQRMSTAITIGMVFLLVLFAFRVVRKPKVEPVDTE